MFDWLFKKSEQTPVDKIKEETKKGFEAVKQDMSNLGVWIKHLENEDREQKREISEIKDVLSSLQEDMDGLKNLLGMLSAQKNQHVFTTPQQVFKKQLSVVPVQTAVETGDQTPILEQFSITERAIIWVLLNYEGALSYEDLAVMLGKEKSTIRGQVNTIRAKHEGLIEEKAERTGKKRIFIPEHLKEKILKKAKVRVKKEDI